MHFLTIEFHYALITFVAVVRCFFFSDLDIYTQISKLRVISSHLTVNVVLAFFLSLIEVSQNGQH